MNKFLLSLCIYLFSCGVCLAQPTIIAFGDSITQGVRDVNSYSPGHRVGGYEPFLEILTDTINNHYNVLNYGLAGERTYPTEKHPYPEGGYYRLQTVLNAQPDAEFCLLLEGTNDIWDGMSKETTVFILKEMVKMIRSYGITPIIGTLTPDTRYRHNPWIINKRIEDYNRLIRQLAIDDDIILADFYPEMIDEWESKYSYVGDGNDFYLHPSPAGYNKMAEIWFEALALPHISKYVYVPLQILLLK